MEKTVANPTSWNNSNLQEFWSRIACQDHLVQFYDTEKSFLDTLEGFVGSGLLAGEAVIVIATRPHLDNLNLRLQHQGFDLMGLVNNSQYIPLEATETLNLFMIDKKPNKALFDRHIKEFVTKIAKNGRKVRAFGEMVAVLWNEGQYDATVELEELWHEFHHDSPFSLYCAYPKAIMPLSTTHLHSICDSHTMLIDSEMSTTTEVQYQSLSARG